MAKARPENEFPTIADLQEQVSKLVDLGLGALPVQLLIVPDSTLQAVARALVPDWDGIKPALMVEMEETTKARIPVSIIAVERMSGISTNTNKVQ